jgi:hypothetical protein
VFFVQLFPVFGHILCSSNSTSNSQPLTDKYGATCGRIEKLLNYCDVVHMCWPRIKNIAQAPAPTNDKSDICTRLHKRGPLYLFSYCEYFEGLTNDVRDTLKSQGHSKPYYYWMGTPEHTQPHEWCLDVDTNRNSLGVYWIIADFFHPVRSSEVEFYDKRWPNFAVQKYPTRVYGPPPFNEREPACKRAIRILLKEARAVTYVQGLKFAPGGRITQKQLASLYERYLAERSKK